MTELHWLGARELARRIAARELSPVEVVRAHLDRIEKLDGKLRSYLAVFADTALDAAKAAERALGAGGKLGLLHGVPVAIKDLFDVQGTPTTAGSTFRRAPAIKDCTVVARLRAAGAIILGKTNLVEFAYGPEGFNPHHGTAWNPWDPNVQRMPGGSSSGSGVAVAAGLAPVGMGSDTGGSIRIPAALCGTAGIKPTYGRVSKAGAVPLAWSLDHAGPLTRSAEDAALVLQAIAGHDPADDTTSPRPVGDYLGGIDQPIRGLRVGLLPDFVRQCDLEVQTAVMAAADVFRDQGCIVNEVTLRWGHTSLGVATAIQSAEAYQYHERLLRQHAAAYDPSIRQRLLVGAFTSGSDYVKGQRARRLLRDEINGVLEKYDALLLPTMPLAAPPITATEVRLPGGVEATRPALTRCTRLFNITGHPAVCVPCGLSKEGLPLSLQLVGRPFDEATVLRLAHAYEKARGAWRLPNALGA